jgi:Transposase DDE domain group 1
VRFATLSAGMEHFKFSTDPEFETRMADVVGLYLDPPERALVLCVDEKSQIQALNRTAPQLPLRSGILVQMTHDYRRNGTVSPFAALEVASGKGSRAANPSFKPVVRYKSFRYQAASWTRARRAVAKVEFYFGELFPRAGFIVSNFQTSSRTVVRFYNKRGTARQWSKASRRSQ